MKVDSQKPFPEIFIDMKKKLTLKLTKKQAAMLLNSIPKGHVITISVEDAEIILGKPKEK